MDDLTPWLVVAGLGVFHGLNPGMGWLFAVALGLHRDSRSAVLTALVPIALGHALSVAVVAAAVVLIGLVIDRDALTVGAAVLLLGWAIYLALFGHRGRVRVGMTAGLAALGVWSFLMATAHGAGLMLVPALIPLCLTGTPAQELTAAGSLTTSLAAVGVHTASMLAVTGVIAVTVYAWVGVAFLRRGWLNLDRLWIAALVGAALFLLLA